MLGSLAVVLLIGAPIARQYPSEIEVPDQIVGADRIAQGSLHELADRIAEQVNRQAGTETAVAGAYAVDGDLDHLAIVAGVGKLVMDLDQELDAFPAAVNGEGYVFDEFHSVPAGALGGKARCGSGSVVVGVDQNALVSMCFWADHGSVGGVILHGRDMAEAAQVFRAFRAAVLRRV